MEMFQKQKNTKEGENAGGAQSEFSPLEAIEKIKKISKDRNFSESIDAVVKLNVDPTKGDQMIRGTCILPNGTGKETKVCVFSDSEMHDDLVAAGADLIGSD